MPTYRKLVARFLADLKQLFYSLVSLTHFTSRQERGRQVKKSVLKIPRSLFHRTVPCILFPILRLAIIIIGFGTLLICSFPVGDFFLKLIEDHHRESPLQTEPYGIIVLGGAIDTNLSLARGKLVFNDSGERLYAGVKLAKKYASAHILLAGYESALSQRFFIEMGIDDSRLLIEDESSHTRENAKFSADLVGQGISPCKHFLGSFC